MAAHRQRDDDRLADEQAGERALDGHPPPQQAADERRDELGDALVGEHGQPHERVREQQRAAERGEAGRATTTPRRAWLTRLAFPTACRCRA